MCLFKIWFWFNRRRLPHLQNPSLQQQQRFVPMSIFLILPVKKFKVLLKFLTINQLYSRKREAQYCTGKQYTSQYLERKNIQTHHSHRL